MALDHESTVDPLEGALLAARASLSVSRHDEAREENERASLMLSALSIAQDLRRIADELENRRLYPGTAV